MTASACWLTSWWDQRSKAKRMAWRSLVRNRGAVYRRLLDP
jgi:hypothetical protein